VTRQTSYLDRDFARFYDWTYEGRVEDIAIYLDIARQRGSQLLELASGTGRLTIPLAQAGFRITGLDVSEEMLQIAREKLAAEGPEVRERVRLVQGDMSDFDLEEVADVAFIPVASFFHLHTQERQAGCLSCVHAHLAARGTLIVDLLPADMMANQAVGKTQVVKSAVCRATGKMTRELNRKLAIDKRSQRVTVEHTYVEEEPDGSETRHRFVEDYTWVTEDEMRGLLTDAGFRAIRVVGGYDLRPMSASCPRMICVAEKNDRGDTG
jgi:SAM-dependent methyltransferase